MLLTPRTYELAQIPDRGLERSSAAFGNLAARRCAKKMLLVHQTGSVKVGEVVRYTLTYTPSEDRILPIPSCLHVRVKNTSAIPLRAAYLHGPYTLYVATYASTFNPNRKVESPKREGVPQFEPNLTAGGVWTAKISVPEDVRNASETAASRYNTGNEKKSVTWVIEISSQILFSASPSVHYELLVGRDENSLGLGFLGVGDTGYPGAGQVQDHQQDRGHNSGRHALQPKGVYSKAIKLEADDTESLWNKPPFPEWDDEEKERRANREYPDPGEEDILASDREVDYTQDGGPSKMKRQKIHLVILTHGLHGNLGADMLYLKESIDAAAKQAREDARARRARAKEGRMNPSSRKPGSDPGGQDAESQSPSGEAITGDYDKEGDEDEQVIVRGFAGNAVRTERGIKYLGKRLARYVLQTTFPGQPFLPVKRSATRSLAMALTGQQTESPQASEPAHKGSTIYKEIQGKDLAYQITSISFISHSLGGLVQTYALAYLQKHSPSFFDEIRPVNFISLATPFLGLSDENPLYVKFALDFGLVGRTGQDLGLTWRPPTLARSGWDTVIGGLRTGAPTRKDQESLSKPLLRVLPTGPAHEVLKRFRNRTVYANVVNDGIVPLRTSCLLFLDWQGLGRVEKARRENGVMGAMAGWGWAQLTGANSSNRSTNVWADGTESDPSDEGSNTPTRQGYGGTVPQPSETNGGDDDVAGLLKPTSFQFLSAKGGTHREGPGKSSGVIPSNALGGFFKFFQPSQGRTHPKATKAFKRGQTMSPMSESENDQHSAEGLDEPHDITDSATPNRRLPMKGKSLTANDEHGFTPPKTNIFESAADVLDPPIPPVDFIIDPSKRPRTIFHDRIYHPQDIPPPPTKHRAVSRGRGSIDTETVSTASSTEDSSSMNVEEKIARAYHRDLSWRKVLVRMEPDAHNNMVVRRMFSNAYGWPVVKHLCDTHFADTYVAHARDSQEPSIERAKAIDKGVDTSGGEVVTEGPLLVQSPTERTEEIDELRDMVTSAGHRSSTGRLPRARTFDSARWSDSYFDVTDDEDEDPEPGTGLARFLNTKSLPAPPSVDRTSKLPSEGTPEAEITSLSAASPVSTPPDADPVVPVAGGGGITEDATQVGLRRTGDGLLKRQGDGGEEGGIVEEVARLSGGSGG
ncbi:MAG: hypothetical protein M1839_004821 [Geoglossum umbratile]|nr:MAG: hypothetical protein M1839_004821 [Geoglossum umbratile]